MFVAFCSLPYIICGIILCCGVPESPKLLYANGKHEEAMSVIRTINRINNSPSIPDVRKQNYYIILDQVRSHETVLF